MNLNDLILQEYGSKSLYDGLDRREDIDELGLERRQPKMTLGRLAGVPGEALRRTGRAYARSAWSHLQTQDFAKTAEELERSFGLSPEGYFDAIASENPELNVQLAERLDAGEDPSKAKFEVAKEFYNNRRTRMIDRIKSIEDSQFLESPEEFRGRSSGWVEDLGMALFGTAPSMGATMINPALGVPLIYGHMQGALHEELSEISEQYDLEIPAEDIFEASSRAAIINTPLELVGNLFKIRGLMGTGPFASRVAALAEAFGGEALTEFAQKWPEEVAIRWALNPDLDSVTLTDHIANTLTDAESWSEAIYEGWIGGMAGLVTAGAGQVAIEGVNRLIHPKQKRINEERRQKVRDIIQKEPEQMTDQEKIDLLEMVGLNPEKIAEKQGNVDEIVRRVKGRLLYQAAPVESEAKQKLAENMRKNLSAEDVNLALSLWDGIARVAAEEGLVNKPEDFYNEWIAEVRRSKAEEVEGVGQQPVEFADTADAIEFGRRATPEQVEALKGQYEQAARRADELKKEGDLQESMNEATRAQFYREAIEASKGYLGRRHAPYFDQTETSQSFSLREVKPRTAEAPEKSTKEAIRRMGLATEGKGQKRKPISLFRRSDGKLVVFDGNATYHALKQLGIPTLEGEIVPHITQKAKGLDQVYQQAKTAYPELERITKDIAGRFGAQAKFRKTGLKSKERAREKTDSYYDGNASRLKDLAGSTLVFKTEHDLYQALAALDRELGVVEIKDRIQNPVGGYRDVLINVRLSNDHIGEILLITESMLAAKKGLGHKLYEADRALRLAYMKNPDPKVKEALGKVEEYMQAFYDAAFYGPADAKNFALSSEMTSPLSEISAALSELTSVSLPSSTLNTLKSWSTQKTAPSTSTYAGASDTHILRPPSEFNIATKTEEINQLFSQYQAPEPRGFRIEEAQAPFKPEMKKPAQLGLQFGKVTPSRYVEERIRSKMVTTGNIAWQGNVVKTAADAASLLRGLRDKAQEEMFTITTAADGTVLEVHRIAKGVKASATSDAYEFAGRVLSIPGARKVWWIHNHPSGFTDASEADLNVDAITRNILALKDIELNSLIIGDKNYQRFGPNLPVFGPDDSATAAHPIPEAPHKVKVPIKERYLERTERYRQGTMIANSNMAKEFIKRNNLTDKAAIIFTDPRVRPTGVYEIQFGRKANEISAGVIAAAERFNASGAIIHLPTEGLTEARRNFMQALSRNLDMSAKVFDVQLTGPSGTHSIADSGPEALSQWKLKTTQGIIHGEVFSYSDLAALREPVYQDKRGAVEFLFDNSPKIIHLFETADASTLIHETGHILLEMMYRSGSLDYSLAAEWAGVDEDRAQTGTRYWTNEELEKFAKAFERYLMEGRAPTMRLHPVFQRIKTALLAIYKTLKNEYFGQVEINDEIRALFDRWVATEYERSQDPFFEVGEWYKVDQIEAELTEQEKQKRAKYPGEDIEAEYDEIVAQARQRVVERKKERKEKLYRQLDREFRLEAEKTVEGEPLYEMLDTIVKQGGLKLSSLYTLYDSEWVAEIIRKRPALISADGVPADVVAQEWGYDTADEMIMEILNSPTKGEAIDRVFDDLWREYEASEHYEQADDYIESLDIEIEILNELLGKKKPPVRTDLKGIIRQVTGQVKTPDSRQLRDQLKRDAKVAREAWREAVKATREMVKADLDSRRREQLRRVRDEKLEAILRLRQEHREKVEALRRAYKVREEREKIFKKIHRKIRQKNLLPEYRAQIVNFLSRYFKIPTTWRTDPPSMSIEQFVESRLGEGERLDTLRYLLQLAPEPKTKGKLNIDETRIIGDIVDALAHYERLERNQKLINEKQTIRQAVDKMIDPIMRTFKAPPMPEGPIGLEELSWFQRMSESSRRFFAELKKAEFIFRALDGRQAMGPNWTALFQPIKKAEDAEIKLGEEKLNRLQEVFKGFDRKWANKRFRIKDVPEPMTKEKMIMVALNAGNTGNLMALIQGNGFNLNSIIDILEKLTNEERALVVKTWDLIDSLFPELDKVHRELTGVRLKKVEGRYFPLVFDPRHSWKAGKFQAERELRDLFANQYIHPKVEAGHRIERKGGRLPVRLDLGVISQHLSKVVHDITHQIPVRNAQKLIHDPEYRETVRIMAGREIYAQLTPWLANVANPKIEQTDGFWSKLPGRIRRNATVVYLGLKVSVAMKQALSLTQTMDEIGLMPTMKGIVNFYKAPLEAKAFVDERSPSMRARRRKWDRELRNMYDGFNPRQFKGSQQVKDGYFSLISLVDGMATYPTWLGAYDVGLEKFSFDEQKAIEYADMVVRTTQPVASPKDLADIQRGGEVKKLFTAFYTFFSVFQNRIMEVNQFARLGKLPVGQVVKSYWFLLVFPALLGSVIQERDLPNKKDLLRALFNYGFAGIPFVRDLAQALTSDYGYSLAPAEGLGKAVYRLQKAITAEDPDAQKIIKQLILILGFSVGLPSNQINIAIDGAMDMAEGKTSNPMRLVLREKKER